MDISPSADEIFDRPDQLTTEELKIVYRDFEAEMSLTPGRRPLTPEQFTDLDRRIQIRVLQRRTRTLQAMLTSALTLAYGVSR
jgi:hypothetical protein